MPWHLIFQIALWRQEGVLEIAFITLYLLRQWNFWDNPLLNALWSESRGWILTCDLVSFWWPSGSSKGPLNQRDIRETILHKHEGRTSYCFFSPLSNICNKLWHGLGDSDCRKVKAHFTKLKSDCISDYMMSQSLVVCLSRLRLEFHVTMALYTAVLCISLNLF